MNSEQLDYRHFILREFTARKGRVPGYSLRAFARDLNVPAPKLSEALSGKAGISPKRAASIAEKIQLPANEKKIFVALVESKHARSKRDRENGARKVASASRSPGFKRMDLEQFAVISEWHYFALLELTEVKDFRPEPEWIARRLGISAKETRVALERLSNLGLLTRTEKNSWKQTEQDLATPSEIPFRAIREQQSQLLTKAGRALASVPLEKRDFSTLTLAVAEDQIPHAKALIKQFRRKLNREMQAAPRKDRVYALAVQFFPLDNLDSGE